MGDMTAPSKPSDYDAGGTFSRAEVQNRLVITAIEERVAGLERLITERITALGARMEERWSAVDKEQARQNQETERRLEILNNENQRLLEQQKRSVTSDKFEAMISDYGRQIDKLAVEVGKGVTLDKFEGFKEKTDQRMAVILEEQKTSGGRSAGVKATMAAIVATIALLLNILGFVYMVLVKK